MLTWLTDLAPLFSPFNLFRYLTFRTIGATATAALFVFFFGPTIIAALRLKQGKGQPIREDGPKSHLITKKGTPTMGGLMILSGLLVSSMLWANLRSPYVWIVLLVTVGFGMIGFYDDYLKVTKQSHKGFSGRLRLAAEALIAAVACWAMIAVGPTSTTGLALPFVNGYALDLGMFFLAFGAFIIVAAGNAVNLTDGLDGLAIVPVMVASATFRLFAYFAVLLLSRHQPRAADGRTRRGRGRGDRRRNRVPLVQRAACPDLHGRYRVPGPRRPHRRDRGGHQARGCALHRGRAVRARGHVGHRPGVLVQDDRQAGVPHGADPPPFRAARLVGAADRDPLLDHRLRLGSARPRHSEGPVR